MSIKAVRGVRDVLPSEAFQWQQIEQSSRMTFEAYGYEEIRLPLFERTELFARGIGDQTDIVNKEMYTFEDRGGDSITLRPEATASLLRAYIEHGFHVHPKPVKLYTIGPMFRYERPQAGRYRQFHQVNVEALGEPHAALDAEMIAMLMDFFAALGLSQRVQLHINSIGDPTDRSVYISRLVEYLRPHVATLCGECQARLERNPLRVLDCKVPSCQPVIEKAPSILDSLSNAAATHFERVREYLDAMGQAYKVTPRLVRGLDYYVRTTFEVKTQELGAQDAVAGGGRYDGLIEQLGGPPDPGIGFAIGLERVALLMSQDNQELWEPLRPQVFVIPLGEEPLKRLLPEVWKMRQAKIRLELGYGSRKLNKELERANKLGAAYAVIVGDNELAAGDALLRDMKKRKQTRVRISKLAEKVITLLPKGRKK